MTSIFDHYAEEPRHKRTRVFDTEHRRIDGFDVTLKHAINVDWIFHEPHTEDCGHAFFNSLDHRGYGNQNDRTEYKTIVAGKDRQNPEYHSTSVQVAGTHRATFDHKPDDMELGRVVDQYVADRTAYEEAVERTRAVAAYADAPQGSPLGVEDAEVGQTAWVHAKGKWRRGVVSKVGRSRVTVEYYVESSGSVTEKAGTAKRPVHA